MILLKRQSNRIPFMASSILNDPLVSNRFDRPRRHSSPPLPFENRPSPFLARAVVPKIDTCNGFRIGDGRGRRGVGGLSLKGCFDSSPESSSLFHKPRLGAANPLLVLRNVGVGVEDEKDAKSVNGHQWGSPLGFPNSTLAEKIVVAVDVDEGIALFRRSDLFSVYLAALNSVYVVVVCLTFRVRRSNLCLLTDSGQLWVRSCKTLIRL